MDAEEIVALAAKAAFLTNEAVLLYKFFTDQLEVVPVAAGRIGRFARAITPGPV